MTLKKRWLSKFKIKNSSWVFVPNKYARNYGNNVKIKIDELWKKPDYYFHLRDGGHIEALKCHTNNYYFIHTDIKDFFCCINKSRLTRNLKKFFNYEKAREIANESTVQCPNSNFKKYILPFGFIQSPILASLCLHNSKLGIYLDKLNKLPNISVSVYMDDIIISNKVKSELDKILEDLISISEYSKFPLNKQKTEICSKITSFNIELSNKKLKITKKRMIEFLDDYKNGYEYQQIGILNYIFSVNKKQFEKFLTYLKANC